jgi:hypothetical protein
LLLSWLASSASASNLLTNGNFSEQSSLGACNDASGQYSNGTPEPQDNLPCGWGLDGPATVSDVNVVAPSTYGLADPEGSANYVAFSGGGGGQDCLTETIPTTIGDTYTISFWVAVTGPVANDAAALTFEWDGNYYNPNDPSTYCSNNGNVCANEEGVEVDQYLYNSYFYPYVLPTYTSVTDEPFAEFTYTVTANLSETQIFFHGQDLINGSTANQPTDSALLLADASIVLDSSSSTPEPTSLLLISLGVVIVGCLQFRKHKTSGMGVR